MAGRGGRWTRAGMYRWEGDLTWGACHGPEWRVKGTYNLTHLIIPSGGWTFESGRHQVRRVSKCVKLYVPLTRKLTCETAFLPTPRPQAHCPKRVCRWKTPNEQGLPNDTRNSFFIRRAHHSNRNSCALGAVTSASVRSAPLLGESATARHTDGFPADTSFTPLSPFTATHFCALVPL